MSFFNFQGTLSPVKSAWDNELHPSNDEFQLMTNFLAGVKKLFPGRVL